MNAYQQLRTALSGLLATCGFSACLISTAEEGKWEPLFNGQNLEGWTQYGGEAVYTVEDGAVVGSSVPNTPNSFLCTKREFGDFVLELEFKVDPGLNSGIQIRSHVRTPERSGRVFGYQVEIDTSTRAWTAGIYDEARRGWLYPLEGKSDAQQAFKQNQWNHVRVVARGDSLRTWLNGVAAADLVDSMTLSGFIALQVHGTKQTKPRQVRWRNIRIQDLGRHEWTPLFNGRNLDGWHVRPGGEWKVENGVIIGRSPASETRHGLLVSDREFSNFTARLRFKAVQGNSGFYFRAEEVDRSVGVFGFQAEIEPGLETGGLYETGGRAWVAKPKSDEIEKWYKRGDWNQMTVSAHGGRIVVHLNDRQTARLDNDPGRASGHLAVQLHGGQPMHVEFDDIELLLQESKAAK